MSGLVYQNYSTRCQGWTNPSNNFFGPVINSLSSLYSPAGSTSLVSIQGENFYSYSSISFGTYYPTVYFISSILIQFYVPSTLNSGTYPVQVFNGSIPSNIVTYTIDNASGYWLQSANGNIINTNPYSVAVSSLNRGSPVIITDSSKDYVVPLNVNWIVCYSDNTITIYLPNGTEYIGRELTIRNMGSDKIDSSAANIISFPDTPGITPLVLSATNEILPINSRGGWVTLVCYDGKNWMIMQNN